MCLGAKQTQQKWSRLGWGLLSLSLSLASFLFAFYFFQFFKFFKSLCSFFFTFKAKIHKFYSFLRFARNNGSFCHFERSDQSTCKAQAAAKKSTSRIQCSALCVLCGYFANAQYDKKFSIARLFKALFLSLQILCYNFILKDKNAKI